MPPTELQTMTVTWPFSIWGIDIIGEVHPKATNGHRYILVAIDYFTKWVIAKSYSEISSKEVASFIERQIDLMYGTPHAIISDNGTHFQGKVK